VKVGRDPKLSHGKVAQRRPARVFAGEEKNEGPMLLFVARVLARVFEFGNYPENQRRPEANRNTDRHRTQTNKFIHSFIEVFYFRARGATLIT
jgi:hypothetical protein